MTHPDTKSLKERHNFLHTTLHAEHKNSERRFRAILGIGNMVNYKCCGPPKKSQFSQDSNNFLGRGF